jgi:RNA polymerase sigma-70 factor (ECF subfamily)
VYRLMGDREDAYDLTQEAFLRVYLDLPRARPAHVQGWVYRIATNVCLDALRHRALVRWASLEGPSGAGGGGGGGGGRGARLAVATPLTGLWRDSRSRSGGGAHRPPALGVARAPDPDADPERCALRAEQAREVHAVLERLPRRYRAALVLREWRGLSYAEIGAAFGVSLSAVKTLLFRARVRFRDEWARTCDRPPPAAGGTPAPPRRRTSTVAPRRDAPGSEEESVSKYLVFQAETFADRRLLLAALADLGYRDVEEGEALALHGYRGDPRPETAELVVRRWHVGPVSNDLGFARTPAGYVPILSEYDQRTLHGGRFLARLRTAYSERAVEELRRRLGGTVQRTVEGDIVRIRVRF